MAIEWGRTLCHEDGDIWRFIALERLDDETDQPFVAIYDEIDLVNPDDDHQKWIDQIMSTCTFVLKAEKLTYLVFDMMVNNGCIKRQNRFEDAEHAKRWLEALAERPVEDFHTPRI